jgi:hypothetical protein
MQKRSTRQIYPATTTQTVEYQSTKSLKQIITNLVAANLKAHKNNGAWTVCQSRPRINTKSLK